MSARRVVIVLAFTFATACEPPPVVPTADPAQSALSSHIDGTVVAQTHARGDAILFLFNLALPPPPLGMGKPLAFTVVSSADLFGDHAGDPTSVGPFTAPFHFSLVPPGSYLIEGFIDLSGCLSSLSICRQSGFIPWYTVADEPNTGDVPGAAADPSTGIPQTVTIDSSLDPATGVNVLFADAQTYSIDRPAFSACTPPGPSCATVQGPIRLDLSGGPVPVQLVPEPVTLPDAQVAGAFSLSPHFFAKFVSVVNGVALDPDGDGQGPDLWPKVVVRKLLDTNPLKDQNVDAHGNPTPGQQVVVLAAGLDPTQLITDLTDPKTNKALTIAVPEPSLTLVIQPQAYDVQDPTAPVPLGTIPPGLYGIYVIQFSGQTWRLPNELDPIAASQLGLTNFGLPSQAAVLQVGP